MIEYQVGEEVLYDGEVYVVSTKSPEQPYRYRLLASRPAGTRFIWANHGQLSKIGSYLSAQDDTSRY